MTRFVCIVLILVSILAFSPFLDQVYIKGHIKTSPGNSAVYIEGLVILVKGHTKVLGTAVTSRNGDFNLTFAPGKETSFDVFCTGLGIDTLLIASIKKFESDTLDSTFLIPAAYKRNVVGKVICLKCEKVDKVYKIVYSDGLPVRMIVSKQGDTTYSNIVGDHYNAGTCINGAAQYYCDRDKVRF